MDVDIMADDFIEEEDVPLPRGDSMNVDIMADDFIEEDDVSQSRGHDRIQPADQHAGSRGGSMDVDIADDFIEEQGSGDGEVEVVDRNIEADVEGPDVGVEVEAVSDSLDVAAGMEEDVVDAEGPSTALDLEEAASDAEGHDVAMELEEGESASLAKAIEEGQPIAADDHFHLLPHEEQEVVEQPHRQQDANEQFPHKGPADEPAKMKKEVMEVDGSHLEGGGQVLRMVAAYSALLGQPVHISNIRAGRRRPGISAQHLAGLRLVQDATQGSLTNAVVGTLDVTLTPGTLAPGEFRADAQTSAPITLMMHAVLLPLLFTGGHSSCALAGGTDVDFSPSLHFMTKVLQPTLVRMGATFNVECLSRGFFPGAGGRVIMQVPSLSPGSSLQAIDLHEPGQAMHAEVVLYTTRQLEQEERTVAYSALHERAQDVAPKTDVLVQVAEGPPGVEKYWLDVVLTTTSNARLHAGTKPKDLPRRHRSGGFIPDDGSSTERFKELVGDAIRSVCNRVEADIASGIAVSEHLLDQLVLPASLAQGKSRFLTFQPSLHALTAMHIAQQFVPGASITEQRQGELVFIEIQGIGYQAPEAVLKPAMSASGSIDIEEATFVASVMALASRTTTPKSGAIDSRTTTSKSAPLMARTTTPKSGARSKQMAKAPSPGSIDAEEAAFVASVMALASRTTTPKSGAIDSRTTTPKSTPLLSRTTTPKSGARSKQMAKAPSPGSPLLPDGADTATELVASGVSSKAAATWLSPPHSLEVVGSPSLPEGVSLKAIPSQPPPMLFQQSLPLPPPPKAPAVEPQIDIEMHAELQQASSSEEIILPEGSPLLSDGAEKVAELAASGASLKAAPPRLSPPPKLEAIGSPSLGVSLKAIPSQPPSGMLQQSLPLPPPPKAQAVEAQIDIEMRAELQPASSGEEIVLPEGSSPPSDATGNGAELVASGVSSKAAGAALFSPPLLEAVGSASLPEGMSLKAMPAQPPPVLLQQSSPLPPPPKAPVLAEEAQVDMEMPSAPQRATSGDDIILLPRGCVAKMESEALMAFKADLAQLSEQTGAEVRLDSANERLITQGETEQRDAAKVTLPELLSFYFSGNS